MKRQGPDPDVVELARKAQSGDQQAFADLFERLHQPVLNYIFHMLQDRPAAEDITQDAFIRAHDRIEQLGPPYDFKSWVFRIAGNLARDFLRAGKRYVDVEEVEDMPEPPTTRRPFEKAIQREEQGQDVWRSLSAMPTQYREALVLREFNQLSYREMATALEVSYDNARQLAHRARLKFREEHGMRLVMAAATHRCRELDDLISGYVDGELDDEQRRTVQTHIAGCEHCQETEEDLKKVGALVAGLAPIIPAEAWKLLVLEKLKVRPSVAQATPTIAGEGLESGSGADYGRGDVTGSNISSAVNGGNSGGSIFGGLTSMLFGGGWPLMIVLAVGLALLLIFGGWIGLGSLLPQPAEAPGGVAASPSPNSDIEATATKEDEEGIVAGATLDLTATPSAALAVSPTVGPPKVRVLQNAQCREGPGLAYPGILQLPDQLVAPIEARNGSLPRWWWIDPETFSGQCYIFDGVVEAFGDLESVPVRPDPPLPAEEDNDPPSITIGHKPFSPTTSDQVTLEANADDDVGIDRIEIWLQMANQNTYTLVQQCSNSDDCVYVAGPFSIQGIYNYYALAEDAAGNQAQTLEMKFDVTP